MTALLPRHVNAVAIAAQDADGKAMRVFLSGP
jgi:hypothetical protein